MLNKDRNTQTQSGERYGRAVKGGVKIYAGSLVCLDANGLAVPGGPTSTYKADGRADEQVDNTNGADGTLTVEVRRGIFPWDNAAGADAVTAADINKTCYVVDDHTVARSSAGDVRPSAGVVVDVDANGVWVKVGAAPAARRTAVLPFFINQVDLLAGTAQEIICPVDGVVSELATIVQAAVTTGGPITVDVGGTPVVGLSVVIPDGAAVGSIVTDTPTLGDASTAVAKGQRIQIIPDAAFATAGAVNGFVEITY